MRSQPDSGLLASPSVEPEALYSPISSSRADRSATFEIDIIDLDSDIDDDDDDGDIIESISASEEECEKILQSHIDKVKIAPTHPSSLSAKSSPVKDHPPSEPKEILLVEYEWAGLPLGINSTVEYETQDRRPTSFGGDFLLIKRMSINSQDHVSLHGLQFQRNKFFRSALPHKRNEVCMCVRVDKGNLEPYWRQGLVSVGIENVVGVREVIITHVPYPELRQTDQFDSLDEFYRSGILICRYIRFSVFSQAVVALSNGSGTRSKQKVTEGVIRRVLPRDYLDCLEDCDGYSSDSFLDPDLIKRRLGWRPPIRHKYTFGDAFCGVGGASLAAHLAGLDVMYGIDHWYDAHRSYNLNFPQARAFNHGVEDLNCDPDMKDFNFQVDVLHLSPPCQYFSPAHTIEGQADEANTAAIFVVDAILDRARPRVVTVEETAGLYERHPNYFYQLLGSFVSRNYSVAYKIVNFSDYGLVQARKRIIIFASGPGIPLPPFPPPTHGEGRKRPVVLADVLLPPKNDDILLEIYEPVQRRCRPYDPKTHQLPGCLTTNGGGQANVHPSGSRDFNLREMAQCQSFPPRYQFWGGPTSIKKQIGNAVPPQAFRAFYREILCTLSTFDWALNGTDPHVRCSPYGEFSCPVSASNLPSPKKDLPQTHNSEPTELCGDVSSSMLSSSVGDGTLILINSSAPVSSAHQDKIHTTTPSSSLSRKPAFAEYHSYTAKDRRHVSPKKERQVHSAIACQDCEVIELSD